MEKIIRFPAGSPTSRKSAIPLREEIIGLLEDAGCSKIILDLSETDSVSGAFADECVGVLVKIYGWETVKAKIRLANGNGVADRNIANAVLLRRGPAQSGSS